MTTPLHTTRRAVLAGLGAALLPACRRAWAPPEHDPTGRSQIKPYVPGAEAFATYEERTVASSCAQCSAACGIRVRVVEGRAVRIEGNPAHPLNRGTIGVRGLSGLQALYDPDRIPQPLRRVGDRLVATTWPAAIELLASRLAEVRRHGPEQLLVLSGAERGATHDLLARFAHAFGTPSFVDGSPSHTATLARAMEQAFGVRELPAYSWEGAGAILSLEAGLFEDACRSTYLARIAAAMRRDRTQRARLFHAGPMFDLAAHNADRWLRIRPGTAGALALGVCHVLLRDGTYDRELVATACGQPEFRVLVDAHDPARCAAITGCDARAIEDLAHELWQRRPVLVLVDERSVAYDNGLATAATAIALSALLGSIENPRGGLRIAPRAPLAAWPDPVLDDVAIRALTTPRLDGAGLPPYAGARAVLDTLPDAIRATAPQVALLYRANPLYARARSEHWREALSGIPFVVSFSPVLDETCAEVADLVLPDHTYLERWDDAPAVASTPRAVVGVQRPIVAPLHHTRATADVIVELAHRLGDPVAGAFPWPTAREAFAERWLGLRSGTASDSAFLDELYARGFWAAPDDATPTRPQLTLPSRWTEPSWHGDSRAYPLALVAYHPLGHGDGSGANQPWLRTLTSRPGLGAWSCAASISPIDAPWAHTGNRVRVTSAYGSIVLPVHVDRALAPGCIAIPTGGGHRAYGRWARDFGANVMALLAGAPAIDTGASLLCTTRVRVEAA
ncbi:MAG TPA: molybdopterin-dependent oxidoreductase [Kofleriaceae bacterium]|nr:molybdopterin-dependent oxidoreductase [Kofleriaceae bacterium]